MKSPLLSLLTIAISTVLISCGGGGGGTAESTTSTDTGTGTTTDSGTGTGTGTGTGAGAGAGAGAGGATITQVTTICSPAPTIASRYARVFKGCNSAGAAQYYDLTECVRDTTTGLIWQGQTPAGAGNIRDNDQIKSNYDDATYSKQNYNGGNTTYATPTEINDISNSIGFQNAVNASNLCGSSAWRRPTVDELLGADPRIDNTWFPNVRPNSHYWSSSPSTNGTTFIREASAKKVYFSSNLSVAPNNGESLRSDRTFQIVRLVR